jgi:hypothetical protein
MHAVSLRTCVKGTQSGREHPRRLRVVAAFEDNDGSIAVLRPHCRSAEDS